METLEITVSGTVQGVFFRKHTRDEALRLGLSGLVSNQPDGTVFIQVTGEKEPLQLFLTWCQTGPPRAKVTAVRVNQAPLRLYSDFQILR